MVKNNILTKTSRFSVLTATYTKSHSVNSCPIQLFLLTMTFQCCCFFNLIFVTFMFTRHFLFTGSQRYQLQHNVGLLCTLTTFVRGRKAEWEALLLKHIQFNALIYCIEQSRIEHYFILKQIEPKTAKNEKLTIKIKRMPLYMYSVQSDHLKKGCTQTFITHILLAEGLESVKPV